MVSGSAGPVEEILHQIAAGKTPSDTAAAACEACGTTFAEFKQAGRLGCPECYRALEKQLAPILDRAHQGAVHHVGKVPRRLMQAGGDGSGLVNRAAALAAAQARAEQIRRLRADLVNAVNAEQYELAARIRDRLRQLQHGEASGSETAEGTA